MLYICPTPIGNLEDITLRVLRVLQEVDVIAAEDTRHTRKLLNHFDIKTPLISLHQHNENERSKEVIALLEQGKEIALVSDAGMPGISDPGCGLIQQVVANNMEMTVLPGPSAITTALVASAMTDQGFLFFGFLPRKRKERLIALEGLKLIHQPVAFYEAPHRLVPMLLDLLEVFGDRETVVARELTKRFEEIRRGTLADHIAHFEATRPKGEFVVVIKGLEQDSKQGEDTNNATPQEDDIRVAVHLLMMEGLSKKDAIKAVAKRHRLPRNDVYQAVLNVDPTHD